MATTENRRTYTIDISDQVGDGLISASDMVSYFQGKIKVKNCLKIAQREVEYAPTETEVKVISNEGNIKKHDMKQYVQRYLRSKSLNNFIKVSGDAMDGFRLNYINSVDEAEE